MDLLAHPLFVSIVAACFGVVLNYLLNQKQKSNSENSTSNNDRCIKTDRFFSSKDANRKDESIVKNNASRKNRCLKTGRFISHEEAMRRQKYEMLKHRVKRSFFI